MVQKPRRPRSLDAGTARQLAVEANVDPRSIIRVLQGQIVRGSAGARATAALKRAGLLDEC
jgi:hypothetical protein